MIRKGWCSFGIYILDFYQERGHHILSRIMNLQIYDFFHTIFCVFYGPAKCIVLFINSNFIFFICLPILISIENFFYLEEGQNNVILSPKLFWLLWEKIVLVIEKKKLKFEAEGRVFAKILRLPHWFKYVY